jgi:hypothetical protein
MNELDIALCNDVDELRDNLPSVYKGVGMWADFSVLMHVAYVRPRLYLGFMAEGVDHVVSGREWTWKYIVAAPLFILMITCLTIGAALYVGARHIRAGMALWRLRGWIKV